MGERMSLNLALLSYWHVHAQDYEREALANPRTAIEVVWDEDPARGRKKAAAIGARFVPNLEDVWNDASIDGVIVTTATSEHHRVMTAAARAGKHIFTEKVIAATERAAREILAAVDEAGVVMMVCLPRLSNGYTQAMQAIIERGEIGAVTYFRMRVGHNGATRTKGEPEGWLPPQFFDPAEAQGGALIDFGAHPLYLTRYLVGMPETVSAHYGYVTGRPVEDHAVVTMGYGSGAIAVAEVSFIDSPSTFEIEVHGERGLLRVAQPEMDLRIRRARANRREPSAWEPVADVPADAPSPFDQWVDQVERGEVNPDNLALALDLTRLAEASGVSAASGRVVRLLP
jgi:predicted dehydrogenase